MNNKCLSCKQNEVFNTFFCEECRTWPRSKETFTKRLQAIIEVELVRRNKFKHLRSPIKIREAYYGGKSS